MHDDDELLTIEQTCAIFGGEKKPINRATYYRGVRAGRFPAPVHPTPGIARVSKRVALKHARVLLPDQTASSKCETPPRQFGRRWRKKSLAMGMLRLVTRARRLRNEKPAAA